MAGVYIHVPFCRQMCNYCSFHFSVSEERKEQMAKAIIFELEERKEFLKSGEVDTLYIGGGTPSLYDIATLDTFASKVRELWGVESFKEFTIEVNPDDLTPDYLDGLKSIGCNRLSIGIQSFDDSLLKLMNRRHSGQEAYNSVKMAQKAGFNNITIDLIYGVPNQSVEIIENDIKKAISLDTQHISAYHLTIEKGSFFAIMEKKGEICAVAEEVSEEHYNIVDKKLQEAGFQHYEISNFAKKGYKALHNGAYWKRKPYLGVGPSAHSFDGDKTRIWNISSNVAYLRAIENGKEFYESETLTSEDCYNEYVMVSLRTSDGVSKEQIKELFGEKQLQRFMSDAKPFLTSEDLIESDKNVAIKCESFLKSDFIIAQLFC